MQRILCAGFVGADIVLRPVDDLPPLGGNRFVQDAHLTIGGCATNTAVALARLFDGSDNGVDLLGRVGDDSLARLLSTTLATHEVGTRHLIATPGRSTAINTALVAGNGERSFFVGPGACEFLTPDDLPDDLLQGYHHLHLAGLGALSGLAGPPAAQVAQRARRQGLTVSLDITLNPPRDAVADVTPVLPYIDLFLPNLREAQAVLGNGPIGELLDRGLARGVGLMGIKLGSEGCALATVDERIQRPAYDVAVLDTSGAGDAWSAAVIYGWLAGWTLSRTASFANAAGALGTKALGTTAGLADVATITSFVQRWAGQSPKGTRQTSPDHAL
jgi:sugar/nucleoside kinase (ribokinase family)